MSRPTRRRVLATLGTALTTGCLRASTETDRAPSSGDVTSTDIPTADTGAATTQRSSTPPADGGLDPSSLSVVWETETELEFSQAGLVAAETVVTQRPGRQVYVARSLQDGSERWRQSFDAGVTLRPRIVGSTVLVGTTTGTLHALALSDGSERWRYETDGELLVLPVAGPDAGTVLLPVRFDSDRSGVVDAVSLASGERQWRIDGIDRPNSISPVVDGRFYLGFSDSFRGYTAADGDRLPSDQQPSSIYGVNDGPIPHRRLLFPVDGLLYLPASQGTNTVAAYDPAANEVRWRYEPFGAVRSFATWGETLAFSARDNAVYGLDRTTGDRRWRVQRDDRLSPVAAARGVVWTARGRTLLGIDAVTGTVHVERALPLSADLVFAVDRRLVVLGSGGVRAYRVET